MFEDIEFEFLTDDFGKYFLTFEVVKVSNDYYTSEKILKTFSRKSLADLYKIDREKRIAQAEEKKEELEKIREDISEKCLEIAVKKIFKMSVEEYEAKDLKEFSEKDLKKFLKLWDKLVVEEEEGKLKLFKDVFEYFDEKETVKIVEKKIYTEMKG